jgi:hypothetical protein
MAYTNAQVPMHTNQPVYITAQPQSNAPLAANPFLQYCNEWSTGLFNCCDDTSQCKYQKYSTSSRKSEQAFMLFRFLCCMLLSMLSWIVGW